jgi:hypothetical protein
MMGQFAELIGIMERVLEESGRPLATKALVEEVNRILVDRPLPESTILTFLMRNGETFVESSPGEWALRSWNPTDQGVSRITAEGAENPWKEASGQINELRPVNQTLEKLAESLLDHLVPPSQDRPILDRLTVFHIAQSSFKSDSLPRDAVDSNRLVPPMLHEQTKNLSWRFPPMMQATFFIKAKPGIQPKLDIRVVFGVASLLEYQEWRPFGETQRIQRRYVSKPEISAPRNFASVRLNRERYYMRENEEAKDFCRKSAEAVFYEAMISQPIAGDFKNMFKLPSVEPAKTLVKAYDETSGQTLECTQVDLFKPSGLEHQITSDDPRWALTYLRVGSAHVKLDLETEYHDDWGVFEITIRLSNNFWTDRRRRPAHYTLLHSIVFPHLYITTSGAQYILGPQQHEECLNQLRSGTSQLSEHEQFIADLTTQTNCVLTRSTKSSDTVIMTPFGVYDTIRVDPIPGPRFATISRDIDSFISSSTLSETAIEYIRSSSYRSACLLAVIRAIQRAFTGPSGALQNLYKYQWKAIQNRLELLASGSSNKSTVIRAPTGAGKTLVFFANAAIHYLLTGQRTVMTFPTRILNEDMFKRLTRFVYALRQEMRIVDPDLVDRIKGGILIGTSDPSYQAIVNPIEGQMMVQYDGCPKCQEEEKHRKVICREINGRLVGVCEDETCQHTITYMAGPRETEDMLPALTIATPDKLFYEATISNYLNFSLRFFGAPCIRCKCGHHVSLLLKRGQIGDTVKCPKCGEIIDKEKAAKAGPKVLPKLVKSPPLYFVLDEVHSLYGITATLMSYFFSLLREMARSFGAEYEPTFETGTATIANEQELIEAMTHQEMMAFPNNDEEFFKYFTVQADRIRYRSVMFMPVGKANRSTITNSILSGHRANRPGGELAKSVGRQTGGAYDFLLAYIPRKANGYIVANEIRRMLDDKSITFLSGDAPTARLVTILQDVLDGQTNLLLANMVVSLGIDIPRLNNMLMLGIPKSMTEMVQTVGRTGRGEHPGHVVIHLQPSIPRDEFVYRHFHRVMGDVTGYFDSKPVAPVNTYVADLIFMNVLHALLATRLMEDYRNCFSDHSGKWLAMGNNRRRLLGRMVKEILGRGGTDDLKLEIARTIQPRLMEAMVELSTKRGFLSNWARSHPEVLYSLRARADRVPVVIGQTALLKEMKKGISRDLRSVEEDAGYDVVED